MTAQKWVRSSLRTLSAKLEAAGHAVSPPTVSRLLRKLEYSLHVNAKKTEASSNHPDRGQQFDYIALQRATFTAAGLPIISTDSKKKELVGDFKNAGQTWSLEPIAVNVHDFPGDADGRAVPYGVYDITANRGFIYLGTSGDTPAFAVDAIVAWWQSDGQATWPGDHLLVLADAGGSNGCRIRAWKERLQVQLCDRFGLTVTVCHYPTGCSKPHTRPCPGGGHLRHRRHNYRRRAPVLWPDAPGSLPGKGRSARSCTGQTAWRRAAGNPLSRNLARRP
jgi:Rhodopirellula transposase DDE domain